jgi:hypothetical protein
MKRAIVEEGKTLALMKAGGVVVKAFASIEWHDRSVVTREGDSASIRAPKKKSFASRERAGRYAQAFADACVARGLRPPPPAPSWLRAAPAVEPGPPVKQAPFRGKKPQLLGHVSSLTGYLRMLLVDAAALPDEDDVAWERRFDSPRRAVRFGGHVALGLSLSGKVGGVGVVYAFRAGASLVLVEGPSSDGARQPDVLRFVVSRPTARASRVGELTLERGVLAIVTGFEREAERRRLARKALSLRPSKALSLRTSHGTRSLLVGLGRGRYRISTETTTDADGAPLARALITPA